jgi:hypothetical protein
MWPLPNDPKSRSSLLDNTMFGTNTHAIIPTTHIQYTKIPGPVVQPFWTTASGLGPGHNYTVTKYLIRALYTPRLSISVLFDGHLPTRLNWVGCQLVVYQICLLIHIMHLLLLFDNCI